MLTLDSANLTGSDSDGPTESVGWTVGSFPTIQVYIDDKTNDFFNLESRNFFDAKLH